MARILLVEDDNMTTALLTEILSAAGHSVTCVADGSKVNAALRVALPDLVITDIFMPDMDGLELVRMMRLHKPRIPVIAMSAGSSIPGFETKLYLELAKREGAETVLTKPIDPPVLLAAIEGVLAGQTGA